jgi:hypothetical protein
MTFHRFEISERFLNQVLPELERRDALTLGEIAAIQHILREDGPGRATNLLCTILNAAQSDSSTDK